MANSNFETVRTWKAARALLSFRPIEPGHTAGHRLQSMRIHVRDHKLRELTVADRTLEVNYGGFTFTQARKGADEARRLACGVFYGPACRDVQIAGRVGRVYELGPEVPADDIDGRSPSVVVWSDEEIFYFIASGEMAADELIRIAASLYPRKLTRKRK